MADGQVNKRLAKKESTTLDEKHKRALRAKRRFKAIVRSVIINRPWLEEVFDEVLGANVKRNVQVLTKKKDKKSLLSIQHKAILNKPADFRTETEKLLLYRIIGGLNCFRKYPDHVKMKLAGVTYFYYFGPGRVIVRQNQEAHALYFIVSGEVAVSITSVDPILNEPVTIIVGSMVAGNMFGEVSLLHDIPRTATITTVTPCELLCLKRADFDTVLKSSIEAQWTEIKQAMNKFRYFDGWDEVGVRECCILAKKKKFAVNQTILGDGLGSEKHVYFVIKGKCRVVEHLLLTRYYVRGKKQYKLYTPTVEQTEGEISMTCKEPESVSEIIKNDANEELDENYVGSLLEKQSSANAIQSSNHGLSSVDNFPAESTANSYLLPNFETYVKKKLKPETSSDLLPENVETFFMQVCIFSETACFNLGENLRNRRIVALTEMECMLIPHYWINLRNKGNIWTRIQLFLDSHIPTTADLYTQFMQNRKWRSYKRDLLNRIMPDPASNIINNVPYSIRIRKDFEFMEKS